MANDDIHSGRDIHKTHTTAVQTFVSLNRGPIGRVYYGKPIYFNMPSYRRTTNSEFPVPGTTSYPRVDVVYAHEGVDGTMVRAAMAAGAKGIVLAGVGDGNATKDMIDALAEARRQGLVVVRSSHVGFGLVRRNLEVDDDSLGFVAAMDLNPQKARVLLRMALTMTSDVKVIQRVFEEVLSSRPTRGRMGNGMRGHSRVRSATALIVGVAMAIQVPGFGTLLAAQAPAASPAKPAAPQTPAPAKTSTAPKSAAKAGAAPAAAPAADPDGGWPRAYLTPSGGQLLLYQPQIASWDNQKRMVGYGAVSYQPKGAAEAGARHDQGRERHDGVGGRAAREVREVPSHRGEVQYPRRDQTREVVGTISDGIPDQERVIALDRVLAHLDTSEIIPKNVEGVKADPPPIFFSTKPAVLVNIDGDPIWSPIKDNDLKYAVNTNWDLFQLEVDEALLLAQRASRGSRLPMSMDRGRPRARCRRASRSCRPTRTGRTSRRRCQARSSTTRTCRRSSSARSPPSCCC